MQAVLVLRHPDVLCSDHPPTAVVDQLHSAAEITLAGLPSERARAIWVGRKWLGCTPRSQHIRDRLDIYGAIAARDARSMLERSRALLAGPPTGGDDWGRYLLSTALLGAHAAGERAEVLRLWDAYHEAFYSGGQIPPYLIYLMALQDSGKLNP
jgi:hypothetical protein